MTEAHHSLLWGLTAVEQAHVASAARSVEFPAEHRIFDAGEKADNCWIISSGHVALDTTVPGRGQVVVQTLGPGDVLGWSWLLPPRRWHFGAVATEPVTAMELDATRLRELVRADPSLGYHLVLGLFEAVVERLQNTRARLLDLYGSPRDR
jgi:CRP-like cAMP-binding protein